MTAIITLEADAGGSPVEWQVRCSEHGITASRSAVTATAMELALRHADYIHGRRNTIVEVGDA